MTNNLFGEILVVGCVAGAAATAVAYSAARVAARIFAAPPTFAPFTFLPVAAGGFGGALAASLIYLALKLIFDQPQTIFVCVAAVALLASFHLPFRLTAHRSPRFAGATLQMQLALCLLHLIVAVISVGALLLFVR